MQNSCYLLDDALPAPAAFTVISIFWLRCHESVQQRLGSPRRTGSRNGIGRADVVAVTRAHLAEESDELELEIRRHNRLAPSGTSTMAAVHDRQRTVKRILVTGGAGFISSAFHPALAEGDTVRGGVAGCADLCRNLENLRNIRSHERLSFVHGDIRDEALRSRGWGGRDRERRSGHVENEIAEGAVETVATNVEGTRVLLDAVREDRSSASC